MFELLLLIGFLYAGFFPPSPCQKGDTRPAGHEQTRPRPCKHRPGPKVLAHKNNDC